MKIFETKRNVKFSSVVAILLVASVAVVVCSFWGSITLIATDISHVVLSSFGPDGGKKLLMVFGFSLFSFAQMFYLTRNDTEEDGKERADASTRRKRKNAMTWFVFLTTIAAIMAVGISYLSLERIEMTDDTPLTIFRFVLVEIIMLLLSLLAFCWFLWRQSEFDPELASTWDSLR